MESSISTTSHNSEYDFGAWSGFNSPFRKQVLMSVWAQVLWLATGPRCRPPDRHLAGFRDEVRLLFFYLCVRLCEIYTHLPPVWQLYERPRESWVMWLPSSYVPKLEMALKSVPVGVCPCTFVNMGVKAFTDVGEVTLVLSHSGKSSLKHLQLHYCIVVESFFWQLYP